MEYRVRVYRGGDGLGRLLGLSYPSEFYLKFESHIQTAKFHFRSDDREEMEPRGVRYSNLSVS